MARLRRFEPAGIVVAVLLLIGVPTAVHGLPSTPAGAVPVLAGMAGGCALAVWRTHPRVAAVVSLGLFLVAVQFDGWAPDSVAVLFAAAYAVVALAWSGRAAWAAAAAAVVYAVVFEIALRTDDWVPLVMLTVAPFVAGTVLRLRREVAVQLAERARELEAERELYAEIALRHERARIAGELHDIVGHAISVMVIQAAAGRRLVDTDRGRAQQAFVAIAESAREGRRDLVRLVDLLARRGDADPDGPDLDLVDEVVRRAAGSGLRISCRLRGDRAGLSRPVAQLGFRVVQESLTNALRYAPGAAVRIAITVDPAGQELRLHVENDGVVRAAAFVTGSGRGLAGLRERVVAQGGRFAAGATVAGGWSVDARLPASGPGA